MSRFLMVDVGAGTMDVLYYDDVAGLHYKSVARSPVLHLAERVAEIPGNLLITGTEMGGGPISEVLTRRAREADVIMTASAALTIHHNLERVRSAGIGIIDDSQVEAYRLKGNYTAFEIGDIEVERLKRIVEGFGVPFEFDIVGACVQDHGTAPEGISHLDFRHNIFKEVLDHDPYPHALLYEEAQVPAPFNRLRSVAQSAKRLLPAKEIYVMDSGMAAILGASQDPHALVKERKLVLDIATSHTVGAALLDGELAGFFEYHTRDISLERLESLLQALADGQLEHERVLAEGGHGAYVRKGFGFDAVQVVVATGPKRKLVRNAKIPIIFGAPLGDNMMTGTVGILEAILRRKGLTRGEWQVAGE